MAPNSDLETVRLVGRNVMLRPLGQRDYDTLYQAEHSEALGPRWRLQGATVSPENYPQVLWQGVLAQFAVVERAMAHPIGTVCAYQAEPADGYAYFAVADLKTGGSPTRVSQGVFIFLAYLFKTWPFRKIYVQTMEYNLDRYRSMCGRLLVEEGRLREHHFLAGRYWDEVTLAVYRDVWERWESRVIAGLLPEAAGSQQWN